jgi:hypothetical protein
MTSRLNYQSLLQADPITSPLSTDQVVVLSGGGVKRITHSNYVDGVLGNIPVRLTAVENAAINGPGASVWPAARTLTLLGLVNGNVTFDGSVNFNLTTTVADGALSISKVSTLASTLVGLRSDVDSNTNEVGYLKPYYQATGDVLDNTLLRNNFSGNGLIQQPPSGSNFTYMTGLFHPSGGSYATTALAVSTTDVANTYIGTAVGLLQNGRVFTWSKIWNEANFDPGTKAPKFNPIFTGTVSSQGDTQLTTVTMSGLSVHNASSHFKQGGYFFKDAQRVLDVTVADDVASGSGYVANIGQFASIPNVKIHITVPGHIVRIGYSTGIEYNGNQVWHGGNFNPASKLNTTSPAVAADRLTNPFTFQLTGVVTGSVNLDGSNNINLTTTIANAAIAFSQIAGLDSALNSKFDKSGGNVTNTVNVFAGTVNTQQTLLGLGWSNQISRWRSVLESDASLSWYSYDTLGAGPTLAFQIKTTVAGGSSGFNSHIPLLLRGNGKHVLLYDNNLDIPVIEMGAGYLTNIDRGGFIYNRNVTGLLEFSGNAGGSRLRLNNGVTYNDNPIHYNGYNGLMKLGTDASPYVSAVTPNTLNGNWGSASDLADMWINYRGYQDGFDYFRTFNIGNGKGQLLARFVGSTSTFTNYGPIVSTAADSFRSTYGNYGTFWRNDGSDLYLMLTNFGDTGGNWNNFRPLRVNLATGNVSSNSSWSISNVLGADRLFAGWDAGVTGAVSCNNWFRSFGQTGIYFNDYGGGWHMTDSTYIRTLNDKQVAANDFVITSDLRYKTDVRSFEYRGRLTPLNYSLIEDGLRETFGFGAQQVMQLYPEAVAYDVSKDRYQLRYGALVAVVSHQVNRVEDDIVNIKNRLNTLEADNLQLRSDMATLLLRLTELENKT